MGRIKLNIDKIEKELPTFNDFLDEEFGKEGTPQRLELKEKATAWYYGELIKEKRKEKHLTQEQLAKKIGKQRTYIARIEKGETDLQISNFLLILRALGLKLIIQ